MPPSPPRLLTELHTLGHAKTPHFIYVSTKDNYPCFNSPHTFTHTPAASARCHAFCTNGARHDSRLKHTPSQRTPCSDIAQLVQLVLRWGSRSSARLAWEREVCVSSTEQCTPHRLAGKPHIVNANYLCSHSCCAV